MVVVVLDATTVLVVGIDMVVAAGSEASPHAAIAIDKITANRPIADNPQVKTRNTTADPRPMGKRRVVWRLAPLGSVPGGTRADPPGTGGLRGGWPRRSLLG
ncbi:MAG TPA: hypothetical protein VGC47_07640, partial [Acidimicrobiia bacterium]